MLSVQTSYPPLPATVYTPHTISAPTFRMAPRGRPNLSLKMPSLTLNIPASAMAPSTPTTPSSATGAMSPTTRNTLYNKRITAPRRVIIEVTNNSSDSESDDEVVIKKEENKMRSVHHPVTPRTGFFPGFRVEKNSKESSVAKKRKVGRRVGFSEDVVVHILAIEKEEESEDIEMKE